MHDPLTQWHKAKNPRPMLDLLSKDVDQRKMQLFGIACYRKILHLIEDQDCRNAVNHAVDVVEGKATPPQFSELVAGIEKRRLRAIRAVQKDRKWETHIWAYAAAEGLLGAPNLLAVWDHCQSVVFHRYAPSKFVEMLGYLDFFGLLLRRYLKYARWQCDILKDLMGDPFRPKPELPAGLPPEVSALAAEIYEREQFDRIREVADALQRAGCKDRSILDHCRSPKPHVRGCWVIDLLTGRHVVPALRGEEPSS